MKNVRDLVSEHDKQAEEVAAIGSKVRELSEARGPVVAAKQKKSEAAMHIIPVEGENEELAMDAARWLERRRAAQVAISDKARLENESLYLYYLRCRNGSHTDEGVDVPPHGIYFKGLPSLGGVRDQEWYSRYKRLDHIRKSNNVVCQVCLKMGIPNQTLSYIWGGSDEDSYLIPDPRWVYRTPKNPALWELVGDSRAFDLPHEAANTWRAEYDRKVAEFQAKQKEMAHV